jgi:hypothetical protein
LQSTCNRVTLIILMLFLGKIGVTKNLEAETPDS